MSIMLEAPAHSKVQLATRHETARGFCSSAAALCTGAVGRECRLAAAAGFRVNYKRVGIRARVLRYYDCNLHVPKHKTVLQSIGQPPRAEKLI